MGGVEGGEKSLVAAGRPNLGAEEKSPGRGSWGSVSLLLGLLPKKEKEGKKGGVPASLKNRKGRGESQAERVHSLLRCYHIKIRMQVQEKKKLNPRSFSKENKRPKLA